MNVRIGDLRLNKEEEAKGARQYIDKTVNYNGKKLIEFCEEIRDKMILNGSVKGDWKERHTREDRPIMGKTVSQY